MFFHFPRADVIVTGTLRRQKYFMLPETEFCMKISGNFLKSIFFIFIFSLCVVLILGWQFAPPAESAEKNVPDEEKLQNYDIRADHGETARAVLGKYTAAAGKSDLQIAAARKISREAAEKLRAGGGNLKIEANEDLLV